MCGIAGALDPDGTRALRRVAWLVDQQAHRGPDHQAVHQEGAITLGIARLSIMAPSEVGNQPLWSRGGSVVAVFNGEIYNNRDLARWLGIDGIPGSDGRVIPQILEDHGPAGLCRLRGMYGFAAVDLRRRRLILGRDPLGIKPLHYGLSADGTLAFASELRPLVGLETPRPLRAEAVARFLHLGALGGDETPFVGLEAVPAGSWIEFGENGERIQGTIEGSESPLVKVPPAVSRRSQGPLLRQALLDTVTAHLQADVPTSLLLSAGTDSTAIAWAARELGATLTCLTVTGLPIRPGAVTKGNARIASTDEAPHAARAARAFGHRHRMIRPQLDGTGLELFFDRMQRPTIDGLNTWVVCRAVQDEGFKVALSGLGGDEALGGYRHFRLLGPLDRLNRLPGAVRRGIDVLARRGPWLPEKGRALLSSGGPRSAWELDLLSRAVWPLHHVIAGTGVGPERLDYLRTPRDLSGLRSSWALTQAELALYLRATLLPDADAFSMAHSVELRVPFVDLEFLAAGLAAAHGRPVGKIGFARAVGDPVVVATARRPKRGFSVPMVRWMGSGPLAPLVERLKSTDAPVWRYVDHEIGLDVVGAAQLDQRWSRVWALAALNEWLGSLKSQQIWDPCDSRIPTQRRSAPAAVGPGGELGAGGTDAADRAGQCR